MDLIDDATGQTRPLPEPERRLKRVAISDVMFAHLLFTTIHKDGFVPSYDFEGVPAEFKVERVFYDSMSGCFNFVISHPDFPPVADGEIIPMILTNIHLHRVAVVDETFRKPGTVHATRPEWDKVVIDDPVAVVLDPEHHWPHGTASPSLPADAPVTSEETPPTEEDRPVTFRQWT